MSTPGSSGARLSLSLSLAPAPAPTSTAGEVSSVSLSLSLSLPSRTEGMTSTGASSSMSSMRRNEELVAMEGNGNQELSFALPTHRGWAELADLAADRSCQESEAGGRKDVRPWGRLVAIDNRTGNIMLTGGETRLCGGGAGSEQSISKHHCRVWMDPETDIAQIEALSENGTSVNGSILGKHTCTLLLPGDEISLALSSTNERQSYVYQLFTKLQGASNSKKRPRVTATGSGTAVEGRKEEKADGDGAGVSGAEKEKDTEASGPDQKKGVAGVVEDSMKCDICHEVWHDCVSAGPCSHNFCAGCVSLWLKQSKSCPCCRRTVEYVSKNYALRRIVEEFLNAREDLRRPEEDLAELDKASLIKTDYVSVKDLRKQAAEVLISSDSSDVDSTPSSPTYSDFSSSSAEEMPGILRCRHCQPLWPGRENTAGRYVCNANAQHVPCGGCGQLMPSRDVDGVFIKCMHCFNHFCDNYWRSQGIPSLVGTPGCESESQIKELREWASEGALLDAFGGNRIEAEIFDNYLSAHNISHQALWQACLAKLDAGDIAVIPPAGFPRSRAREVTSSFPICTRCAPAIWKDLVYKFREAIPNNEFPPEVAARVNCWYGRECRTQLRSEDHARRLNHVCPNTRPAQTTTAFPYVPYRLRNSFNPTGHG